MPHVELSLIDSRRQAQSRPTGSPKAMGGSLARWAATVCGACEPCLVVDCRSTIVAASAPVTQLLRCGDPATARGRQLHDALVHLVDFSDPPDTLDKAETGKIPPLLAISSKQLARGLIRIGGSGRPRILDAVATPLWEGGTVVGSLTFFSQV